MPKDDASSGFATFVTSQESSSSVKVHPGRGRHSNGCLTCRRRKIKCDEGRPVCGRCKDGFHECLGYSKPLIWVNQGPDFDATAFDSGTNPEVGVTRQPHHTTTAKAFKTHGSSNLEPLASTTSCVKANVHALQHTPSIKSKTRPRPRSNFASPDHISPMLALHGFKEDIVISHMITKFAIGLAQSLPQGTDAPTMVAVLQHRSHVPSAAYTSGLSLAEAFFGKVHKMDDLVEHSALLYGQGLRCLRDDLQQIHLDAVRDRAYMNLWSSLFLGLYELVSSSSSANWLEHCFGVSALTRALGPYAFQDTVANAMFQSNRSFIVIGHIVQRKRCFLEELEWQTIPWANAAAPKSLSFQLQDIFCDIPGIMEDADNFIAASKRGEDIEKTINALQRNIIDTCHRLGELRWAWEQAHPMVCWEIPSDTSSSLSIDDQGVPLFKTTLHFQSIDLAVDIIYFNAIRLLLYSLSDLAQLTDLITPQMTANWQRQGPFSNPLLIPGQGDPESHALEMCRTVDYMMQEKHDSLGAFMLLFPLRVAYTHLGSRPVVYKWLRGILGQLSIAKGFQIGEHILNLDSRSRRLEK